MIPDDNALTNDGLNLSAKANGRVLLLACGALAREILALKAANGWGHLDLHCLPAKLHLTPNLIPDAVEQAVTKFSKNYETIFVVYADCGTGGLLQARCRTLGVEMIAGPHCYSFFEGNVTFSAHLESEMTAFYLTDFLVRQFDAFVIRPLGLDRHPELREDFFGNYSKLVYLAQTQNPELDRLAQAAAARLGLDYERRQTGYGDLAVRLAELG